MKYFKILLLVITFSSVSNASMLYGAKNICIEYYYIAWHQVVYMESGWNDLQANADLGTVSTIQPNYIFDVNTRECRPDLSTYMGVNPLQFNFLLGLIGIIFGAVFMFFTVDAFIKVGGKR